MTNQKNEDDFLEAELQSLEEELESLIPQKSSFDLNTRLDRAMFRPRQKPVDRLLNWGTGLLAASLLFVLFNTSNKSTNLIMPNESLGSMDRRQTHSIQPVSLYNNWERVLDEGPDLLDNKIPIHRFLKQRVQTFQWFDPYQDVQIEVVFPEERLQHRVLEVY